MKNITKILLSLLFLAGLSSCDNRLEIVPKGMITLNSLDEVELLLNQSYHLNADNAQDVGMLVDECYTPAKTIDGILADKLSLLHAYLTYDETVDRIALTPKDNRFMMFYKYTNFMNVVIEKAESLPGNEDTKKRLSAEAKVIRAYMHFLAACFHARQYDKATAESLGGIGYVTDLNVTIPTQKLTLAESFEKMLSDCSDENLSCLSEANTDPCRVDRATGYAVKAKILFQMKEYDEAMKYAEKALQLNNQIEDRSVIKTTGTWALRESAPNNYLFVRGSMQCNPLYVPTTPSTTAKFEEGDYTMKYCVEGWSAAYGERYTGIKGPLAFSGWDAYGNPYGLRVEHMYYIMAECLIRKGEIAKGLKYVDDVREKRIENYEQFSTRQGLDVKSAMKLLQDAKLIEFFASCERFLDCKRWNSEPDYRQDIVRDLGEKGRFTLKPDSPLWVMPFPADATSHNELLTQNY